MAVDVISVARAAAQAALGDEAPKKKNGLSPWRGLAIGAALVTVGRMAAGPGGRFVRELVQEHSSDGSRADDGPELEQDGEPELDQDGEPERDAEADEPDAEADDEPEADEPDVEADKPDADADDEPDAEADKPDAKADDEPEAGRARRRAPGGARAGRADGSSGRKGSIGQAAPPAFRASARPRRCPTLQRTGPEEPEIERAKADSPAATAQASTCVGSPWLIERPVEGDPHRLSRTTHRTRERGKAWPSTELVRTGHGRLRTGAQGRRRQSWRTTSRSASGPASTRAPFGCWHVRSPGT